MFLQMLDVEQNNLEVREKNVTIYHEFSTFLFRIWFNWASCYVTNCRKCEDIWARIVLFQVNASSNFTLQAVLERTVECEMKYWDRYQQHQPLQCVEFPKKLYLLVSLLFLEDC